MVLGTVSIYYLLGLFKFQGEHFGDAVFAHGNAIENIRAFHGDAVVGYDDKLGFVGKLDYELGESAGIFIVQGSVYLV